MDRADQKLLTNKHRLEKLDSHHRYGRNLKLYWNHWRMTEPDIPFFKWLDEGEGRFFDHQYCDRAKLERERVRYLDEIQRKDYEVVVEEGKLKHRSNGEFVDTNGSMYIYVFSPSNCVYVGEKVKGEFHHSSFLAGGEVLCAGHVEVDRGTVKALSQSSGHYMPKTENFQLFMGFLAAKGVDLKGVRDTGMEIT